MIKSSTHPTQTECKRIKMIIKELILIIIQNNYHYFIDYTITYDITTITLIYINWFFRARVFQLYD